jgi:hypothetical protein
MHNELTDRLLACHASEHVALDMYPATLLCVKGLESVLCAAAVVRDIHAQCTWPRNSFVLSFGLFNYLQSLK